MIGPDVHGTDIKNPDLWGGIDIDDLPDTLRGDDSFLRIGYWQARFAVRNLVSVLNQVASGEDHSEAPVVIESRFAPSSSQAPDGTVYIADTERLGKVEFKEGASSRTFVPGPTSDKAAYDTSFTDFWLSKMGPDLDVMDVDELGIREESFIDGSVSPVYVYRRDISWGVLTTNKAGVRSLSTIPLGYARFYIPEVGVETAVTITSQATKSISLPVQIGDVSLSRHISTGSSRVTTIGRVNEIRRVYTDRTDNHRGPRHGMPQRVKEIRLSIGRALSPSPSAAG